MVEDFVTVARPRYDGDPNFMASNFLTLSRQAPAMVVVWDTGTAGEVVTVGHPLAGAAGGGGGEQPCGRCYGSGGLVSG